VNKTLSCVALALALTTIGCPKKAEETTPPEPVDPGREIAEKNIRPVRHPLSASSAAKTPVAAKTPGGASALTKISCEKLIPEAIRKKYFAGSTMKQEPMCPGCPEHCKFSGAGGVPGPTVMADCRWGETPGWFEKTTAMWEKQKSYVKATGVGRVAYAMGGMQFLFVPQKHNCYITITWLGGEKKLPALAKEIDSGLTPAALGK
jgi:hypothetical protein